MTQINPAYLVVFQQLLRRAVQGDLALRDNVGVIREFQSFIDVLLHDHNGRAELVDALHEGEYLLHELGHQAERRFVEHQQLRPAHHAARDGDHLLLAAGECARKLLCAFLQAREALIHVLQICFNYYSLFVSAKKNDVTFEYIIRELYRLTGNVEASFSSKMLATIDASKPVWDKYVLQNLGLELTGKTPKGSGNPHLQYCCGALRYALREVQAEPAG